MAVMGNEIGKELIDALGLPKQTVGFSLRCYANEIVTVECEYYPEDKGLAKALARYSLVRRPDGVVEAGHPADAIGFDAWMRERTEAAHAAYMARHSGGGKRYGAPMQITVSVDTRPATETIRAVIRDALGRAVGGYVSPRQV